MFQSFLSAQGKIFTDYREKMQRVNTGQEPNPQYTWKNVGAVAAHAAVGVVTCLVIVKVTAAGVDRLLTK